MQKQRTTRSKEKKKKKKKNEGEWTTPTHPHNALSRLYDDVCMEYITLCPAMDLQSNAHEYRGNAWEKCGVGTVADP